MILLKILGVMLAVILLIIVVVLLLPVDVLLFADDRQGIRIRYRFLGKLYGETPDPNNPVVHWLKQVLGLSHLESIQAVKETVARRKTAALAETAAALITVVDRVFWLLRYCRISLLRVETVSGGEDAAVEYGTVCATVYPLAGYFQKIGRLKRRATQLQLCCDYEAQSRYDMEVAVRVTVVHAVCALLYAMFKQARRKETSDGTV